MRIGEFALLGIGFCWTQPAAPAGAAIGKPIATANRAVTVCVSQGPGVFGLEEAEALASKMFAKIGVILDWPNRYALCSNQQGVIIVTLSHDTPSTLFPGAWAYALPYEGTHIVVFYDRLTRYWGRLVSARPIMAHVLVHEIAHILEGVEQHSETGIMRARWGSSDYRQMSQSPLAFTDMDVQLIRLGLAERQSRARRPGSGSRAGRAAREAARTAAR